MEEKARRKRNQADQAPSAVQTRDEDDVTCGYRKCSKIFKRVEQVDLKKFKDSNNADLDCFDTYECAFLHLTSSPDVCRQHRLILMRVFEEMKGMPLDISIGSALGVYPQQVFAKVTLPPSSEGDVDMTAVQ
jgi:hypothetical protein